MKKSIIFFLVLVSGISGVRAQSSALNILGLWQLVDYSKSENKLQNDARNNQALVTANEAENRTMLTKLKETYRMLQHRYQTLGTVIDAADIGIQATPMVNRIVSSQAQLYELARSNPAVLLLAYQTETEFVDKAHRLVNYLAGLCASLGDVNQMKPSDRKLLFDFVLTELSTVQELSAKLVSVVSYANLSTLIRSLSPFEDYISQDQSLVKDIIAKAKYLGQ